MGTLQELGGEPGLADSGVADDRHEARRARRGDLVEAVSSVASSSSRPTSGAPRRTRTSHVSRTATRRYAGTGSDFPLSVERLHLLDLDVVADEPVGELAEEHLALAGRLLEARRDVDRVAGDEALPRRGIARDDLTRVDTRPVGELDAVHPLQLAVERLERGLHPGRSANGAQRVVLVEPRQPEDRHHGVADELLDHAAVTLELARASRRSTASSPRAAPRSRAPRRGSSSP